MRRKEKETLELECKLTKDELIERSKELSKALIRKKDETDRLTNFRNRCNTEIKLQETIIEKHTEVLNRQTEFRNVECRITYRWEEKTKHWIREDTGEEVKNDTILEEEMQEEANLQGDVLQALKPEDSEQVVTKLEKPSPLVYDDADGCDSNYHEK